MTEIIESITLLERMKEIQRIQYDYFKTLITLSTGSILVVVAFLEKVFTTPPIIMKIPVMISLVFFAATICLSLRILPLTGNIILYINGLQGAATNNDQEERKKYSECIGKSLDCLHKLDTWSNITYLAGIISLLAFACVGLFN